MRRTDLIHTSFRGYADDEDIHTLLGTQDSHGRGAVVSKFEDTPGNVIMLSMLARFLLDLLNVIMLSMLARFLLDLLFKQSFELTVLTDLTACLATSRRLDSL